MKVLLFMVISANGYIATSDGSEDFLSHHNWITFCNLAKEYGGFIWGRKTYEAVKDWGNEYHDPLVTVKKVILSSNTHIKLNEGYILANTPQESVHKLNEQGVDNIIVTGGSTINSAFAKEGLIDEVKLNIEPAILGKGIPLFNPEDFYFKLETTDIKKLDDGIFQITYSVVK